MKKYGQAEMVRRSNALNILECIRNFGPITKDNIKTKTGLSWGAISNITSDLVRKSLITESLDTNKSVGRTPYLYDVNSMQNLIIGVDLNIAGIRVVIIDLKCNIIHNMEEKIEDNKRDKIINQTKRIVHQIIDNFEIEKDKIIGIGIAMQGVVDVQNGISVFTPYFQDWKNVHLKDFFELEFNLPVYVEHDPNCMALTEIWLGTAGNVDNLLFIRLSMGIGLSIIINKQIIRGVDGCAGELGHIIMNPDGEQCTCGNYGCLEVYSSGRGILERSSQLYDANLTPILKEIVKDRSEISIKSIYEAALKGDAELKKVFNEAGEYLGKAVANIVNILNPELIIIGGKIANYNELFLDSLLRTAKNNAWKNSRIDIEISKYDDYSAAIGAGASFIQEIFLGNADYIFKNK